MGIVGGHPLSPQRRWGQGLGTVVFCHLAVSHSHTCTLTWAPRAGNPVHLVWNAGG